MLEKNVKKIGYNKFLGGRVKYFHMPNIQKKCHIPSQLTQMEHLWDGCRYLNFFNMLL